MVVPQFMPRTRDLWPRAWVVVATNAALGLFCLTSIAVDLVRGPRALSRWWELLIPIALVVWGNGGILAALNHVQKHPSTEPPVDRWGRPMLRTTKLPIADWPLLLAFACFVLALMSMPAATKGQPDLPTPSCPYRLAVGHGSFACVSQRAYTRARAANHRLFFSGAAAVCALEVGLAVYILHRREPDDTA